MYSYTTFLSPHWVVMIKETHFHDRMTTAMRNDLLNDLECEPLQERGKQARHKLLQKSLKEEVVLPSPADLQRSVWITC